MKKSFDVFLSHNKADKEWTEYLATRVEADRSGPALKVFFDKWDILPGGDIPAELEEGLQTSRYVGLVLSPESLSSDWTALERSAAVYRDPRGGSRSNRTTIRMVHLPRNPGSKDVGVSLEGNGDV